MGNQALYRFMDKVKIQDGPIKGSPCWIWTGAKTRGAGNRAFYGQFSFEGKKLRAHIFSTTHIKKVECPKGFERHHICEDTLCVCPEHIDVITQQENCAHRWADDEYEKLDYPPF